jgi:hypothetical protein
MPKFIKLHQKEYDGTLVPILVNLDNVATFHNRYVEFNYTSDTGVVYRIVEESLEEILNMIPRDDVYG